MTKGNHPKTEFKKNRIPWNKGINNIKNRYPCGHVMRRDDGPHNCKRGLGFAGRHHTEKTKAKMRIDNLHGLKNKLAWQRILKEVPELQKQGFRVIPITKVVPDIIAIKDGKVFAIEVEYGFPNYKKYTDDIKQFFDDVWWIIRKKQT